MELILAESSLGFYESLTNEPSYVMNPTLNIRRGLSQTASLATAASVDELIRAFQAHAQRRNLANLNLSVYQHFDLCIQVSKMSTSNSSTVLHFLVDGGSRFNILKELRERFQDKVRISFSWTSGNLNFSAEEVKITEDYICAFGVCVNLTSMNALGSPLNLLITARITDDENDADDALVSENEKESIPTLSSLAQRTKMILDDALSADIIITAGNGVEVKAHKCFLMGSSSVFRTMFQVEMKESKTGRVDMTEMSEDGVRAFLRYIYFDDGIQQDEDISVACELLGVAHKYHVSGLETDMIEYLLGRNNEDFDPKVAFKLYVLVKNLESAKDLKAKIMDVFHLKMDELKKLPEYNELFTNPADSKDLCENLMASLKRKAENADHDSMSKVRKAD